MFILCLDCPKGATFYEQSFGKSIDTYATTYLRN